MTDTKAVQVQPTEEIVQGIRTSLYYEIGERRYLLDHYAEGRHSDYWFLWGVTDPDRQPVFIHRGSRAYLERMLQRIYERSLR